MIKRILATHDGSKASDKAVQTAIDLAQQFRATLTVISVIPELYFTELVEMDRVRSSTRSQLMRRRPLRGSRRRQQGSFIENRDQVRQPAEEILAAAARVKADLIVTGSHGRHGAEKFFLGSVSSKVG